MRNNRLLKLLAGGFFLFVLLLSAGSSRLAAQVVKGSISGSVIDASGAAVPGADITATNTETGGVFNTASDNTGLFHLALIPVGSYKVEVLKSGFAKLTLSGVEVNSAQDTGLGAIELHIGQVTTAVEVSAAPALIETTQAQVSTAFTGTLLQTFPGIGENEGLDTLALQLPGVVNSRDLGFSNQNGVEFAVNGLRGRSTDQQIDGQNNNDNSVTGPAIFVADSNFVQEYQVTTNNFGPEYGRNSGSVINVITKSGTNDWHGSIYGTEGNSALNSLTNVQKAFEGLTKVPHFNDEFTGATIGGPLAKDKYFIFGGFSNQLFTGAKTVYATGLNTPTPTGIGQLAGCFPDSTSVAALRQFGPYGIGAGNPTPQGTPTNLTLTEADGVTPCTVQVAGVQRTLDTGSHQYNAVLRIDAQGKSDHVYGRWLYQRLNFFNTDPIPGAGYAAAGYAANVPSLGEDFGLDWSHTISSRMVNEARFSYGRITVEFGGNSFGNTIPTQQQLPNALTNISFLDPSLQPFGPPTTFPQGRIVNTYQTQDNWSYFLGKHQIKAGVNWTYQRSPDIFLPNINGQWFFPDLNAFALNTPLQVNVTLGNPSLDFREHDLFMYVGDDFKVKPNLTLNLGLTWSYFTQASNLFHASDTARETGDTPFWNPSLPLSVRVLPALPTPKDNFGPSIGFAWTPNWGGKWTGGGKTVLRGGFRLTYDPSFYNIYTNIASSAPQVLANTVGGSDSGGLPAQPFGPVVRNQLSPFLQLGVFDPRSFNQTNTASNFRPDRAYEWTFGIQREINPHLVAEARYVGNHGSNLFQSINFNPRIDEITSVFPNAFPGFTPCPADQAVVPRAVGRINCDLGVIRQRTNTGYSNYDALQFEVRGTNIANQLTLRTSYTYSHTLSNADEIFGTFAGGGTVAFSQNPLSFKGAEYGNSGLDIPQNWTLAFTWNIPAYRDQKGVMGKIFGGWGMSGSYLIGSGQPYTATQFGLNQTYYDVRFNGSFNSGAEGLRPFAGSPSAPASAVGIYAADACNNLGFSPACSMPNNTLLSLNAINASGAATTVNASQVRFVVNAPFADSVYGTPFGNVGRNTLRDYYSNIANFTFFRDVRLTERLRVNAYVSFVNVFNHPNFSSIDPFVDDAGLAAENTGFATPSVWSGGPASTNLLGQRLTHFGLKITF